MPWTSTNVKEIKPFWIDYTHHYSKMSGWQLWSEHSNDQYKLSWNSFFPHPQQNINTIKYLPNYYPPRKGNQVLMARQTSRLNLKNCFLPKWSGILAKTSLILVFFFFTRIWKVKWLRKIINNHLIGPFKKYNLPIEHKFSYMASASNFHLETPQHVLVK